MAQHKDYRLDDQIGYILRRVTQRHLALFAAAAAVRLYAESHPRPPHVTQSQAGEMLRLSPPAVSISPG